MTNTPKTLQIYKKTEALSRGKRIFNDFYGFPAAVFPISRSYSTHYPSIRNLKTVSHWFSIIKAASYQPHSVVTVRMTRQCRVMTERETGYRGEAHAYRPSPCPYSASRGNATALVSLFQPNGMEETLSAELSSISGTS